MAQTKKELTEKERHIKIAENHQIILDSIRKGLIQNMENIDILKVVEFDFTNNIVKLRLPYIEKNISFDEILKLLDKK